MLFFKKKRTFSLGIDIGRSTIKLCELEKVDERPMLNTYGMVVLPEGTERKKGAEKIGIIQDSISRVVAEAGVASMSTTVSLSTSEVLIFEIDIPRVSSDRIEEEVKNVLFSQTDHDLSNKTIDWQVVEEFSGDSSKGEYEVGFRILVSAAPDYLVDFYQSVFEGVGVELDSLEIESTSLVRSLVGTDSSPIVILDIGYGDASISLIDRGHARIARKSQFGGQSITRALSRGLGIEQAEAEQFKRDHGFFIDEETFEISEAVRVPLRNFVSEVSSVVDSYFDLRGREVEKIVLTGGSARLKGMGEFLERELGVAVYAGNPWARVIIPREVQDSVRRIGPEFSVAIGLAMRNL